MKRQASIGLAIVLFISMGCSFRDQYWSFPVWRSIGESGSGSDSGPSAPLDLSGFDSGGDPRGALALLALIVVVPLAAVAAVTSIDLALMPITLPHDIWLSVIRDRRRKARNRAEYRGLLFEDDPEAMENQLKRNDE